MINASTSFNYNNGLHGEVGRLTVCYSEQYIDICNETSVNFDTQESITSVCQSRGYTRERVDDVCTVLTSLYTVGYITSYDSSYSTSGSGLYVTNIDCPIDSPPGGHGLEGCNLTVDTTCTGGSPLVVQCLQCKECVCPVTN